MYGTLWCRKLWDWYGTVRYYGIVWPATVLISHDMVWYLNAMVWCSVVCNSMVP